MDAYQHFNLARPPFDPAPESAFYHDASGHSEALATAQYVARYRKRCCVVVGQSGMGKTLLARIVSENINQTAPVFWVHGGGQSDNHTNVRIYPSRTFNQLGKAGDIIDTTLRGETHVARFMPDPPLLIVDAADEAPEYVWRDVLAWVANEVRYPKPVNVLLFGLPGLLEILNKPEMECLRQRIFRACRIETLTCRESEEYITARIKIAGGSVDDIFNDDALTKIIDAAGGVPGRINKLCDNAMIEAFSEERSRVILDDVGAVMNAQLDACLEEQGMRSTPKSTVADPVRATIMNEPFTPKVPAHRAILPIQPIASVREETSRPSDSADSVLKGRIEGLRTRMHKAMEVIRVAADESVSEEGEWRTPLPKLSDLTAFWAEEEARESTELATKAQD